jgi:hypothetical protein
MVVCAVPVKPDGKEDPEAAEPPKFETLNIFGTVGILFNIKSKFVGDNSCNLDVSEDEAKKFTKEQYVIHLA